MVGESDSSSSNPLAKSAERESQGSFPYKEMLLIPNFGLESESDPKSAGPGIGLVRI